MTNGYFGSVLLRVVLALCLIAGTAHAADNRLLVFGAASLQNAMDAVVADYEAKTGTEVVVSYAGSSTLARQIESGAPVDVYVSANRGWVDYLEKAGFVRPGSRIALLGNRLVLIAPEGSHVKLEIKPHFELLDALGDGYLAMANTRAVPAGIYGKQALQWLGVWTATQGHIAQAVDVRAALVYVARGAAPLGIVYASDAVAEDGVGIVDRFPQASHEPIIYPAVILKHSDHPRAQDFMDFLQSEQATANFKHWGFCVLDADPPC